MLTADPVDLLAIDSALRDDERAYRTELRAFLEAELAPHVAGWFERGSVPRELWAELGRRGLLGMQLEGHGCPGGTAVLHGLACHELEAIDSGLRSMVAVHGSLAMYAIATLGSDGLRDRWLPAMAAGEAIGCFALSEPGVGSDPSSMTTTARRDGGGWVIDGTKAWITNGSCADVAIVWARTDDGLRGFAVPTATPGFSATDVAGKLSLRTSTTSVLTLDSVRIPDADRLPGATGLRLALRCLGEARYGIAWGAAGVARACLQAALDYAGSRVQFGSPIAGFQLTQAKLVDMCVAVDQGLLLALHLGRLKDDRGLTPEQESFGKLANTRMAARVARIARGVFGANGVTLEYPVMRHMANIETLVTYDGTAEVHTLALGAALTGLPAFRSGS